MKHEQFEKLLRDLVSVGKMKEYEELTKNYYFADG